MSIELFDFEGFSIPVPLLNMTGGGVDTFKEISDDHIVHLQRRIGVEPHHHVLEVGCGIGRDAIPLGRILTKGKYTGVDIIKDSVDWCRSNIGVSYQNFEFYHFDVSDQLHNPLGKTKTTDIVLPVADGSVDRIILWSVFTHMLASDIRHYLKEFSRILSEEGRVFASCFIVDDAVVESARRTNFPLSFVHPLGDGCFVHEIDRPLAAIAYTEGRLRGLAFDAGLAVDVRRGQWSGHFSSPDPCGQDAIVLSRR